MHSKSNVEIQPTLQLTQKFISACRTQPTSDRRTLFSSIFNMEEETIDTMEFFGMAKVSTPVELLENQLQSLERLDFNPLSRTHYKNLYQLIAQISLSRQNYLF